MSLNIEQILGDMAGSMAQTAKDGAGDIGNFARQILNNQKESLQELGEARVNGEIDDETFAYELEREKKVTEAELLTIEIMTLATAQKAVNAAIKIFEKSVKALM